MKPPLLQASGLTCDFGRGREAVRAVAPVDLTIKAGEVVGVVGESGSGKTTLGRMLCGLQARTAGEVRLDGLALPQVFRAADFRRHGRAVQMVFQDSYASLNPRLTVGESLGEPLAGRHPADEIVRLSRRWLERVQLTVSTLDRYPHELSGGQLQRVGIARAFIGEPRLVVCDEPVSALDVSVQATILTLLAELQRETGVALLYISHDLETVRYLCERVIVMYRGHVLEEGAAPLLFDAPAHPYTQVLMAARPRPDPSRRVGVSPELNLSAAPVGACCFMPRCELAAEDCLRAPGLAGSQGHRVACYRSGE